MRGVKVESPERREEIYRQLGEEITLFLKVFVQIQRERANAERHMRRILSGAQKIGGPLLRDVEILQGDFIRFLEQPISHGLRDKILRDALRIQHEVSKL